MKKMLIKRTLLLVCAVTSVCLTAKAVDEAEHLMRMEDEGLSIQAPPATVDEVAITAASDCPEELLALWYEAPATNWVREALPIGNGDMGAMIFGGIAQDRVQFNHKTLWKGSSGATDLGSYLAFGDLYVINRNAKEATGYRRVLDMAKAAVNVTVRIQSHSGTPLTIAYPKVKGAEIAEKSGRLPAPKYQGENIVTIETIKGREYLLDFSSVQWEAEEYDIYEPRNTGSKNRTDRNVGRNEQ